MSTGFLDVGRRGRGEGTIYRRSDGRWEGRADLGWQGGLRKRPAVYGRTRAEVGERIRELQQEIERGAQLTGPRQTVAGYLEDWLLVARQRVRPTTYATYEMYVRYHVIPELGRIPLRRLGPEHVQRLLLEKQRRGMKPQTAFHMRAVLRTALNRALRLGLVVRNAAALADAPRVERPEVTTFSPADARRFMDAIAHDDRRALYLLALLTGMRQGELLGLRWIDVDLDGGALHIRQALQRLPGHVDFVPPKTKRSRRQVLLPPLAIDALRQHRSAQLERRLLVGSSWEDSGLVFTGETGRPLVAGAVTHTFQRLLEQRGLPRMRFHDLRHSCATLLLSEGVHPSVVMDLLGHSTIRLTLDTYSHVLPTMQAEAVARLERVLRH